MTTSFRIASLRTRMFAGVAAAALVFAACGGDDDAGTTADSVSVSGAWARSSPMASDIGALYVMLEAQSDDELMAVVVSPAIAGRTEMHETAMVTDMDGGHMGDDMDGGHMGDDMDGEHMGGMGEGDMGAGVMTMRQVQRIELPAGQQVELKPGGLHVMLLDLVSPLQAGDSFEARLVFADADPIDISVDVRDDAP